MRKTWIFFGALTALPFAYAAIPFDGIVIRHSAKYGFDPLFVHAVIQQESRHNPRVCSSVGACGLMQLMPATGRELGVAEHERFNPDKNVAAGTRYLRQLHTMFGNSPNALRAYNWGMGNMRKYLRRVRNGQHPKMPKEAFEYAPRIAWHYYNYGGKGNMFQNIMPMNPSGKWQNNGGEKAGSHPLSQTGNPNRSRVEQTLGNTDKTCPRIILPEQEVRNPVTEDVAAVVGIAAGSVSGQGKVVFDPAKSAQLMTSILQAKQSLDMMRGQYDALTKGLVGLGLLTNIASIAGYEMPETMTENQMVKWGNAQDASLYSRLQEMKAADTGVYASAELDKMTNQNAAAINKAYTETEFAWSKANCAANNLHSLAKVRAKTQKQAKDLNNAIKIETAVIEANTAKIKANILMMSSSYQAYRINAEQIYASWKGSQK